MYLRNHTCRRVFTRALVMFALYRVVETIQDIATKHEGQIRDKF